MSEGISADGALARRPVQHIGYVVPDITEAVDRWVTTFGAGPFFWLGKHIQFDQSDHNGEPCVLDHSAVIGPWGDIFVELAEVHKIRPEPLAQAFLGSPAGPSHPNHISYVVPDPEAEGKRLEALGLTKFWHASRGPLEISYYDGRDINGLAIEIHRLSDAFTALFDRIGAAAAGWDGSDPIRDFPL